jgi:hypothetical protein
MLRAWRVVRLQAAPWGLPLAARWQARRLVASVVRPVLQSVRR